MVEKELQRAAFVKANECKPKKCNLECKKYCPVNKIGKRCIEVKSTSKISYISEEMCIGCGICVKKCPFNAIQIINLPKNLEKQTVHRYGPNTFKLHRLPIPRPGKILGLVGTNGIGKSTALNILGGLKPNFGDFKNPPEWEKILKNFRGSELQSYFLRILEDDLKAVKKPQYVDRIPLKMTGTVRKAMSKGRKKNSPENDERYERIISLLELEPLMDRNVADLSGGELQRMAIAMVCVQRAGIYIFDEPSSFLDVKQRLQASWAIRSLVEKDTDSDGNTHIVVVEHDLSVLDYLSDYVCVLYGKQGAYGVVTSPFSVREGINHFLEGFIPTENLRFRDSQMSFKFNESTFVPDKKTVRSQYMYPALKKSFDGFQLEVCEGSFSDSEIIVLLGQNGTGKSTLIKLLAGETTPDDKSIQLPQLAVSYKPQNIQTKFEGSVRCLLHEEIRGSYMNPSFVSDVLKPLMIEEIIDHDVQTLSGGELQRVMLTLCLGKKANLYLFDEPSAYLDSEQRIITSKVIKKFILGSKRTAFVVEHDFIMATYLADRIIVYEGTPAVKCKANAAQPLVEGMNQFLRSLGITFRRDPGNFRPRINKLNSQKDQEQKASGDFFASSNKARKK